MNARVPESALNAAQALGQVSRAWDEDIVHRLEDYIRIPAKSPAFDADWVKNGFIDTVMWDAATWVQAQKVEGLTLEIIRLEGRTPVLFFEVPASSGAGEPDAAQATSKPTVLMYGHLDKQPEFTGWRSDLGPWTPKYENGKLYGRGGADDGYAVYASIAAIQALKSQQVAHPRIVGLIETCE
ncbi:M20/M25/M40 family metallo-hydrolase, partial [Rhodoferax sp. UBA5149]|uniref:M20/M25/M40 family metallo-hydrolase n=1 Tax=Rhodoferax sp. UBA5149 TaxID=1947379 RepID=UPI0025F7DE9A